MQATCLYKSSNAPMLFEKQAKGKVVATVVHWGLGYWFLSFLDLTSHMRRICWVSFDFPGFRPSYTRCKLLLNLFQQYHHDIYLHFLLFLRLFIKFWLVTSPKITQGLISTIIFQYLFCFPFLSYHFPFFLFFLFSLFCRMLYVLSGNRLAKWEIQLTSSNTIQEQVCFQCLSATVHCLCIIR